MGKKTTSRDGTALAYEVTGQGPVVILVSGAMSTGGTVAPLAARLADRCTAVVYDRRGRGASDDTAPYAVAREVEDLAALIDAVGGDAALFGVSSGGALVLRAAASGLPVRRVAVYEVPYADFLKGGAEQEAAYKRALTEALAAVPARGRGGAVPAADGPRRGDDPGRPQRADVGSAWRPSRRVSRTTTRSWATGCSRGRSSPRSPCPCCPSRAGRVRPGCARRPSRSAGTVPRGSHRVLEGQTHMVEPEVLGPVLADYFTGPGQA
ncbi:alpha/beta fold hydrolase [Streptomyces lasalocidi]